MSIQKYADVLRDNLKVDSVLAEKIIEKSIDGGEIKEDLSNIDEWINDRLLPNCVLIDETGYSTMCINALKIVSKTAATDFGSSRQRDFGQIWADMTRGYLGEYAFKLFLKKRFNIDAELGHELGNLEDYLPMDLHQIIKPGDHSRPPKIKVGIKAVKWNGIWLDIPGDQFGHSDIHAFVKIGAGRDHLFAFFKQLSVFKDKVLKRGEEIGCLTKDESATLFKEIPAFSPVTAYICGFARKDDNYKNLFFSGKKGRKNYTIRSWRGEIRPGDLDCIKQAEEVSGKISFIGIGEFSHDSGYLFNAGNLYWKEKDWKKVADSL